MEKTCNVARIPSTEIPWLIFSPRFSKEYKEGEERPGEWNRLLFLLVLLQEGLREFWSCVLRERNSRNIGSRFSRLL